MSYKIGICDDEEQARNHIKKLVHNWARENMISADIRDFESAEEFLFHYEESCDFDILLLDIEMPGMDGVTLAKNLRAGNEAVQIIFITGYSDYIAEGYEVSALHYLMKPVQSAKLFEVLERAKTKLCKNEKKILLESSKGMIMIPVFQIRYVDVRANYITIHAKEDFTIKKTLSEIEKELDDRFFRVGRSAIVNLTAIQRVSKSDIVLTTGESVPLPRGNYDKINKAIINCNC